MSTSSPLLYFVGNIRLHKVMHHNSLIRQQRIRIQLFLHKLTGTHDHIHHPVGLPQCIIAGLYRTQNTFHSGIMDTAVLTALPKIAAAAGEADLSCGRNPHHMIRANPLIVMRRVYEPDMLSMPFFICAHSINNRGRQLEINIIQMHHIRMKVFQHAPHLSLRFSGINNAEGIEHFTKSAGMKIHIGCVASQAVAYYPPCMLHAKILHLIPLLL